MDIKEFLDQDQKKDLLRLLTAGSVDDGKSTLIGRLLFDSKKLYEDQLDALKRDSEREGHAGEEIDYALLLDGLKAEREQGITIDVAYRYFSTAKRKFIIADTPGHEQYTRNMVTGASTANLAIILIDARKGVITQTRRHSFLVSLLGIKHVVLAVNKMDLVDYSQEVYDKICKDYSEFVTPLGFPDIRFFPLSALKGENIVNISDKMPWYHGKSILEHLETIHITSDRNFNDFRYPVQYVVRPSLDYRGFAGNVASGIIKKGDEVMVLPSRKKSIVKEIVTYDGNLDYAFPPQSVTLTLEDEIDVSRGDMLVHPNNVPKVERHFEAMLVWMDEEPMNSSTQFIIKHVSQTTKARIDKIRHLVDVNTLEKNDAQTFELNEIGRVNIDREKISSGVGLISKNEFEKSYEQSGSTIWITGLHGSGKNELAYTLHRNLFDMGAKVMLLDGKSVRMGLSRELDYSPTDRAEHLRRVANICRLMNDQGILVICSFVSPNEEIRTQVADIIGKNNFDLIYLDADIDFCRKNDEYGIYKQADSGKLKYLPGVDMEYQAPTSPSLTLIADNKDNNLETVIEYLAENKVYPI